MHTDCNNKNKKIFLIFDTLGTLNSLRKRFYIYSTQNRNNMIRRKQTLTIDINSLKNHFFLIKGNHKLYTNFPLQENAFTL